MESLNPLYASIAVGITIFACSLVRSVMQCKRAYRQLYLEADAILEAVGREGLTSMHAFNLCEVIRKVQQETGEKDLRYGIEVRLANGRKRDIYLSTGSC